MEKRTPKSSTIKPTKDELKEKHKWKQRKAEERNRIQKETEDSEYEELFSDRCRNDDPE